LTPENSPFQLDSNPDNDRHNRHYSDLEMLSFKAKRDLQKLILEQNKILAGAPSFAAKRAAQKTKLDALTQLGAVKSQRQITKEFHENLKEALGQSDEGGKSYAEKLQDLEERRNPDGTGKTVEELVAEHIAEIADDPILQPSSTETAEINASGENSGPESNNDQSIELVSEEARPEENLQDILANKQSSARFYNFDPNRKKSQRKKDNASALAILNLIDAGQIDPANLDEEQKSVLAKYSGTGGALVDANGKKGSAYEYYTPKPIAEGMWGLMRELGFSGGKVLDPSSGVGIFGGTAPNDAAVDAVELNAVSGRINGLVNSGPGNSVTISPFEEVAASTPDGAYDAIITNVPFGSNAARGGNQFKDKRYQDETLENYFILRSMEKLKPGGLAVFITPPRCVSGKGASESGMRQRVSYMAEFLGAYRLPNSVFGTADADTITDVIAFRKFSTETLEKISELREQAPEILSQAKVVWDEFVSGDYFKGEGRRFVLGEFVPKDPNKFRDVDRVVSDKPVGEVAQMLNKFPDSRIDWALLETAETAPIIYQEGDTITQAGQTLQLQDGAWIALKKTDTDAELLALLKHMTDPYTAFEHNVSYDDAMKVVNYMNAMSKTLDIPDWLRGATSKLNGMPEYWRAGVVGLSVAQVLHETAGSGEAVNYLEQYAALSEAMERVYTLAKSVPVGLAGDLKDGMKILCTHYSKKKGFSAVWRGDVLSEVQQNERTVDQSFEGVRYRLKSSWVPLAEASQVMGDDFNPLESADFCLSGDGGSVTKAGDYYVGNYGEFLRRLDREIAATEDAALKAKLLRQKTDAAAYVDRVDPGAITFNLFSPYVTIEEKAEFLRRFVDPRFAVSIENSKGETVDPFIILDGKRDKDSDKDKLLARLAQYLKNGTITLGGAQTTMSSKQALNELRKMVNTANEQFGPWVKSNRAIMDRITRTANDPDKLRFRPIDDESAMPIPGLNNTRTPHGYQFSFVRKQGREFGGINGFNVGLGKTLSSLAAVQHAHNIGVKKKTMFVVPNSVLSNWRKEAMVAYETVENCLFVGLRTDKAGKDVVKSSAYDEDLLAIRENRHSKIFVTMEAFERIRLKEETITAFGDFLRRVDASFAESELNAEEESTKSKHASLMELLRNKTGSAPFLEDLGIDSIVIDEAHAMKNAAIAIDTKKARYLSLSKPSGRGFDAQAKAWYIRGQSPLKDGVLLLTATPITNSPLEIFSMMSLAVGHERVNDTLMGIRGADNFLSVVCDVQSESDVSIDGIDRDINVFQGLNNVTMLRKALLEIADIKDADDVGAQIVVPEEDPKSVSIQLPDDVKARLIKYKGAFRYAVDMLSERKENRGDRDAYDEVSAYFGESALLIGHPFNLINKMTLLIADPELDARATFYTFSDAQKDLAAKVVNAFNAKKIKEKRAREMPLTRPEMVVGRKRTVDPDTEEVSIELTIQIEATIQGNKNRIAIDTMDAKTQSTFEAIAEKEGLDLDVTVPPKVAALLENFQNEAANPRGMDADGNKIPFAKQIIFCDILPLHNKIKRILSKRAGVPSSAIAIITGQTNNSPDEILDVQNGFNASGEDNKYRVIIANEKAEVGINLQIGTQAIHHLTIGWTPDSLTQRNGRGVRQGNKTEHVSIYHYDADGTFDVAKRSMVGKKAEWIDLVMDVNGGDKVAVTGGLSREQMEALIDTVGDADGMTRLQESIAAKEAEARAATNRDKQLVNISTVQKQLEFIKDYPDAGAWAIKRVQALYAMDVQLKNLQRRLRDAKTETAAAKNKAAIADIQIRFDGLMKQVDAAAIFKNYGDNRYQNVRAVLDAIPGFHKGRGETINDVIENRLSRSGVTVDPDSELQSDWQSEYDMAQSLIAESVAGFKKRAGDAGAYPSAIIDKVAAGESSIIFGKPVVIGAFMYIDGTLAVVTTLTGAGTAKGWIENENGGRENGWYLGDALKNNELIYPGTAAYVDALIRAAQIEDKLANAGITKYPYSDAAPEVKQYRKNVGIAEYSLFNNILPSPYFPVVITEDKAKTPIMRSIFESQKPVINGFNYSYFKVAADVEILEKPKDFDWLRALKDYALAHGVQMIGEDVSQYGYSFRQFIGESVNVTEFSEAIKADTAQKVKDKANQFIAEKLVSWFESTGVVFGVNMPLPYDLGEALRNAVHAANMANISAETTTTTSETAAPTESPNDVVAVSGSGTKRWKDDLKEYGSRHKPAGYVKSYYWDGANVQWLISRAAWNAFIADNPQAAESLTMKTSFRKTI
jgi:hypothetical protein